MLIDWFTVGAQALNFIILVWLMKHFLYQPILNAIDAREKKIADELARADTVSQEASQAKASFEAKNREFDQQRDKLMTDATAAAETERQRLLEDARKMAEGIERKQQQALHKKMQDLHQSLRTATQKEVFSMTKSALRDLARVDIETQIVAVFLQQLHALSGDKKIALQTAFKSNSISIVSSSLLTPDQKSNIEQSLQAFFGDQADNNLQLQFEQSADLIGGIELTANGFKFGWSVAEYLHLLEDSLAETLNTHITADLASDLPDDSTGKSKPAIKAKNSASVTEQAS